MGKRAKKTRSEQPLQSPARPAGPGRSLVVLLLAALVVVVFFQTLSFQFLSLDDDHDVYRNPNIMAGVTPSSLAWDWTALEVGHWIPLTRLSHQIEFELYGPNPMGFHAVNVMLHLVTTIFLFLTLERMSGARIPSALAVSWFAVHPMRSESVAWVVERKDCLSGTFAALALYAYVRYAQRDESKKWLAAATVLFVLGLLSKASVAPIAVLLLLLDAWPLRRLDRGLWKLVVEKLPMIVAALFSGIITLYARSINVGPSTLHAGASAYDKFANLCVSFVLYLRDTLLPVNLSVLYPFRTGIPVWQTVVCTVILAAITVAVLRRWKREPWWAVAWLWFIALVLPLSGVILDGIQSRADRYMYLPHIMMFFAVSWSLYRRFGSRILVPGAAVSCLLAVLGLTNTSYWKDSPTLFAHSIAVTGEDNLLVTNLAYEMMWANRLDEAERLFALAARTRPLDPRVHVDLADILLQRKKTEAALREADEAVRTHGDTADAHQTRAAVLAELGRHDEALAEMDKTIALSPRNSGKAENFTIRGEYLQMWSRYPEAEKDFRTAIRLADRPHVARRDLANCLFLQGRYQEAIEQYEKRLAEVPGDTIAAKALAEARAAVNPAN